MTCCLEWTSFFGYKQKQTRNAMTEIYRAQARKKGNSMIWITSTRSKFRKIASVRVRKPWLQVNMWYTPRSNQANYGKFCSLGKRQTFHTKRHGKTKREPKEQKKKEKTMQKNESRLKWNGKSNGILFWHWAHVQSHSVGKSIGCSCQTKFFHFFRVLQSALFHWCSNVFSWFFFLRLPYIYIYSIPIHISSHCWTWNHRMKPNVRHRNNRRGKTISYDTCSFSDSMNGSGIRI